MARDSDKAGCGESSPHWSRDEFFWKEIILQFRAFSVLIAIYVAVADSVKRFSKWNVFSVDQTRT